MRAILKLEQNHLNHQSQKHDSRINDWLGSRWRLELNRKLELLAHWSIARCIISYNLFRKPDDNI